MPILQVGEAPPFLQVPLLVVTSVSLPDAGRVSTSVTECNGRMPELVTVAV